ncbi:MAG: sulfatase-like hydrolase/transferase [Burkholderiaceae bacterium]|jgi:phosphoglycerol transferase MdoB-like AlkP superfamily enzyme|nr:sulfatase-like hydrolase/transferase [Burkholderiaceae bacterium]
MRRLFRDHPHFAFLHQPVVRSFACLWIWFFVTALMFLLIRLVDFLWNRSLFLNSPGAEIFAAFKVGLWFDVSAIAHILVVPALCIIFPLPGILARKRWQLAAIILLFSGIPLFFMGWVDIELVRYVKSRLTLATVFILGEGDWKLSNIFGDYLLLIIVGLSSIILWAYLVWRVQRKAVSARLSESIHFSVYWALVFLITVFLLVVGIRGGVRNSKPLKTVDTHPDLDLGNWALNTPFTFIKSLRSRGVVVRNYFQRPEEIMPLLNGSVGTTSKVVHYRRATPQNVVVFIMESLSLGYMGRINGVTGFTPFLDKLAGEAVFFPNAFANASRSIDGIPAVLAGIPALGTEPFLVSPYANADFEGMGTVLARHGYTTAFFHAARKGSMSLDKFAVRAGFQHHFSRENYPHPEDYDGSWGIYDEPFFQYVLVEIDKMHKQGNPFAISAFSLSAHFPFNIPSKYEDTLPKAPHRMMKAQAYADLSLRKFFEGAREKPWFKNTLFVITADHGALQYLDAFRQDPLGAWRIPVIFYHPSIPLSRMPAEDPIQQIDILPSVLDILGLSANKPIPLGRSVFVPGPRVAVIRSGEGNYAIMGNEVVFEPDSGGKPFGYVRGDADTGRIGVSGVVVTLARDRAVFLREHECPAALSSASPPLVFLLYQMSMTSYWSWA